LGRGIVLGIQRQGEPGDSLQAVIQRRDRGAGPQPSAALASITFFAKLS
jgi:hypothetical protein